MDKKKTLRPTVSQNNLTLLLQTQPARDTAAIILPVEMIKLGENVRRDLGDISDLVASISEHGLLQPVVVAQTERGLELVAGFRRLEAAKRAGLVEISVRLIRADDVTLTVLRLVENIVRENLSPQDEVRAVLKLSAYYPDQTQLAKAIGKSKTYVSRALRVAMLLKENDGCARATQDYSKSALLELADTRAPEEIVNRVDSGKRDDIRAARNASTRKSSGPLPGGRYNAEAITFHETNGGRGFRLKINFDWERTPPDTKESITRVLREILEKIGSPQK